MSRNHRQCANYRVMRAKLMIESLGTVISVRDDVVCTKQPATAAQTKEMDMPTWPDRPSVDGQAERVAAEIEQLSGYYASDRMLGGVADIILRK